MLIPPATGDVRVWLRVGTLLDGTGAKPLRNAHIVYDRRAILHVGDPEQTPPAHLINPGQRQPDLVLPDYTLLPGLIEAHAHFFLEGGELDSTKRSASQKRSPDELLLAAELRLEKLARLGVIAVRDAGDKDGVGLALSKRYRSTPRPLMPYVDSPGAAIHRRGRYGSFMGEPLENFESPQACVAARVDAGADRIKIIPTGIINFQQGKVTTEPQMTAAEISALVGAAKSFERQTFAHASGDAGIDRALEGGVDTIEHGFLVRDDQLARLRDKQIGWVPTFAPVQAQVDNAQLLGWDEKVISNMQRILDQHAESLVKAHDLGVIIIAGSDAGSYGVAHGIGFLRELELMERAGLAPMDVITAATGNCWGRLAFPEKFGQIKPGFASRFILTRFSPLQGIVKLTKPKYVVYDGMLLDAWHAADASGM
jgi:imidazolonepropionase-like amidohydrolase